MELPLRALLKRVFYRTLRATGEAERRTERARREGHVTVLNLHRVSPVPNPYYSPLTPAIFGDLLDFLSERYRICTFEEVESDRGSGGERPPVVLSFDDGYRDFVDHARPALEKRGLRANQNIIVSSVESGKPPWTIELADFLQAAPSSLLRDLRVPGFHLPAPTTDRQRTLYGVRLSHHLKMRPRSEREPLFAPIRALMDRLGAFPTTPMMTAAEVREAAAAGHDIGAHSYGHESMGYESQEYFLDDLARCQRFFQESLQLPLTTYAFPNGSHRPEQIEQLRAQGVRRVLLVEEKLTKPSSSVYARLSIAADSRSEARLQATGFRAAGVL